MSGPCQPKSVFWPAELHDDRILQPLVKRRGFVEQCRVQIHGRMGAGASRGLDSGLDLLQRHGRRPGRVGDHGPPLLAVGMQIIAVKRVISVLGGQSHVKPTEQGQVGVIAVAASALGVGGRKKIEIVDADVTQPRHDGEILVVPKSPEGGPCRVGVAAMHAKIAADRAALAGFQSDNMPHAPCALAVRGSRRRRLNAGRQQRGGEQRDSPRLSGSRNIDDRGQQERRGRLSAWWDRGFEIMTFEAFLADVLAAVLEPLRAAQLGQARIAEEPARGKRQIGLLIDRPQARPRRGCETDFHRLDAIRRVVQGDFGLKRIFFGVGACRQLMMRQSDFDGAASAVWVCGRQSGFRAVGAGGVSTIDRSRPEGRSFDRGPGAVRRRKPAEKDRSDRRVAKRLATSARGAFRRKAAERFPQPRRECPHRRSQEIRVVASV